MSAHRLRDLAVGFFVFLGLAAIAYLSLSVGGIGDTPGGMTLYATFDQVADLKPRAPVDIAGVKVGQVVAVSLADDYRARVTMDLDPKLQLPVDSSAAIVTAGLLGDRYIQIELGAEEQYLTNGEEIGYTESAIVLERLIGKVVHNFSSDKDDEKKGDAAEGAKE
jgi:phospholipid/cholesterol/gamma-HCH transport system substrate-binding protein